MHYSRLSIYITVYSVFHRNTSCLVNGKNHWEDEARSCSRMGSSWRLQSQELQKKQKWALPELLAMSQSSDTLGNPFRLCLRNPTWHTAVASWIKVKRKGKRRQLGQKDDTSAHSCSRITFFLHTTAGRSSATWAVVCGTQVFRAQQNSPHFKFPSSLPSHGLTWIRALSFFVQTETSWKI